LKKKKKEKEEQKLSVDSLSVTTYSDILYAPSSR